MVICLGINGTASTFDAFSRVTGKSTGEMLQAFAQDDDALNFYNAQLEQSYLPSYLRPCYNSDTLKADSAGQCFISIAIGQQHLVGWIRTTLLFKLGLSVMYSAEPGGSLKVLTEACDLQVDGSFERWRVQRHRKGE